MPVKTRSQTKRENKNHLIACSVARDVVDDIISKIEEEEDDFDLINHEGKEYMVIYKADELQCKTTGEIYIWRRVMDEDCNHVGYWTGKSIEFITKRIHYKEGEVR